MTNIYISENYVYFLYFYISQVFARLSLSLFETQVNFNPLAKRILCQAESGDFDCFTKTSSERMFIAHEWTQSKYKNTNNGNQIAALIRL